MSRPQYFYRTGDKRKEEIKIFKNIAWIADGTTLNFIDQRNMSMIIIPVEFNFHQQ